MQDQALDIKQLIENFDVFFDWEDRYRYLIDLGKKLPPMPEQQKNEANEVDGCMSKVWMTSKTTGTDPVTIDFLGDSDAFIVKGLIGVLFIAFSGKTADQILATDIEDLFEKLGLGSHLSINRRNGFYAMVQRIKALATTASKSQAS